jgi:hypothetical protein
MYRQGGLAAIRHTDYGHYRHELTPIYDQVEQAIEQSSCNTLSDVRDLLAQRFSYQRNK